MLYNIEYGYILIIRKHKVVITMKYNTSINDTENEKLSDMLKTIAIYEAKSAVVKIKVVKRVADFGLHHIGNTLNKVNSIIDHKIKDKETMNKEDDINK